MRIESRFLKYISFDTQSDSHSETVPSTSKQLVLADFLVEEMKILGMKDARIDEHGIVMGTIPGNMEEEGDIIGFIAHMDTSPDASGKDIHPQIIRDYDGSVISLNENMSLDPEVHTMLKELRHHDLITTDGTTLLGGDDKAGIAIIMSMAEYLYRHPEFLHHDIKVAFTCDEEIGRGVDYFDVEAFGADYAYTIDGGDINEYNYENFYAYLVEVNITGRSYHPGDAKGKMINALTIGRDFDTLLGDNDRPEHTQDYEGFYHLHQMSGDVSYAKMTYIVREHDFHKIQTLLNRMEDTRDYLNNKYGRTITLTMTRQYDNMKEIIEEVFPIVEQVDIAMKQVGLDPRPVPIRGGTDGAMLCYKGLPCPNLGTGGYNFHGPYEFVSLTSMKKGVQLLLRLIKNNVLGK